MTSVAIRPEKIQDTVVAVLGDKVRKIHVALGEVTVEVAAADYLAAMQQLRDAPGCQFEQLIDCAASTTRPMPTKSTKAHATAWCRTCCPSA